MKVGLVFTSATEEFMQAAPELALNLSDAPEIIDAVRQALEAGGHTVMLLNTDRKLPVALAETPLDIVFNIATGFYGDSRQANVPAMLEYLNIPHTGSSVLAEVVAQDKPLMKNVLLGRELPTPAFQVFRHADDPLKPDLRFPLIVKLPSEGGSLGMTCDSVVHKESELRRQVAVMIERYHQGALAEAYIDGREFTVSILGNNPPYMLPIVERVYPDDDIRIQLDWPETTTLEMYQRMVGQDLNYTYVDSKSVAPADLPEQEARYIEQITLGAYQALGFRDWARMDLRMDSQGSVYIIDVNLEPAIGPDYALARSAYTIGWTYTRLVNRILEHAIERYPRLHDLLLQSERVDTMAPALTS